METPVDEQSWSSICRESLPVASPKRSRLHLPAGPVQMEERMLATRRGPGPGRRGAAASWCCCTGWATAACGRANEFIADHFSAAAFRDTRWAFPTAAVTCNRGCSRSRNATL
ncbi:hypothetical protein U9M48_034224 [Paspalum notatum var. saurae]|uniref:Uncharacterized protein n=1 Tax=Paspalum notatum var. saurae TaxID=547442 RepID=A0AAQ3X6L9_PASNO